MTATVDARLNAIRDVQAAIEEAVEAERVRVAAAFEELTQVYCPGGVLSLRLVSFDAVKAIVRTDD